MPRGGLTFKDIDGNPQPLCILPGNADKDFEEFTLPIVEESRSA